MLSNKEITKRLTGGYGTKAGAKNRYLNILKKKGLLQPKKQRIYLESGQIYETDKRKYKCKAPLTQPQPQIQLQPQSIRPIIAVKPKNVGVLPPPPPPSGAPPPPPPNNPVVQIKDSVNKLSLSEVIKMNKKLNEGKKLNVGDKGALSSNQFMDELLNAVKRPALKKASDRQLNVGDKGALSSNQFMDELLNAVKRPALKKASDRQLSKKPEKKLDLMSELTARIKKRREPIQEEEEEEEKEEEIEFTDPVPRGRPKIKGSGLPLIPPSLKASMDKDLSNNIIRKRFLKNLDGGCCSECVIGGCCGECIGEYMGGYFYDDDHSELQKEYSKKFLNLIDRRNEYGFYKWYAK